MEPEPGLEGEVAATAAAAAGSREGRHALCKSATACRPWADWRPPPITGRLPFCPTNPRGARPVGEGVGQGEQDGEDRGSGGRGMVGKSKAGNE